MFSQDVKEMIKTGQTIEIWPLVFADKNLASMSYSPTTGLAYANRLEEVNNIYEYAIH